MTDNQFICLILRSELGSSTIDGAGSTSHSADSDYKMSMLDQSETWYGNTTKLQIVEMSVIWKPPQLPAGFVVNAITLNTAISGTIDITNIKEDQCHNSCYAVVASYIKQVLLA